MSASSQLRVDFVGYRRNLDAHAKTSFTRVAGIFRSRRSVESAVTGVTVFERGSWSPSPPVGYVTFT